MMVATLRVGFFEDFKGEDTVLFSGDTEAVVLLAGVFEALALGRAESVRLESLPLVQVHRQVSILAERSPTSSGLRYAAREAQRGGPCFVWRLSAEDWEDVALRVASLQAPGSGHQFLSGYLGVLDDVQVIVAAGEYSEEWW